MPIHKDDFPIKDHTKALIAIFGSIDNYINSDILKEIKARITYLEKLRSEIGDTIQAEKNRTKWWMIYNKAVFFILGRLYHKVFHKEVDFLLTRYRNSRGLPVPFLVNRIHEDCAEFFNKYEKIISLTKVGVYHANK